MTRVYAPGGGSMFGGLAQTPFVAFQRLSPERPAPNYIYVNPKDARRHKNAALTTYGSEELNIPPGQQRRVFIPEQQATVKNWSLTVPPGEVFTPSENVQIQHYRGSERKAGIIDFARPTREVLDEEAMTFFPEDTEPYPSDMPGDIRPVGPYELPEGTPYMEPATSAEGICGFGDTMRIGEDVSIGQDSGADQITAAVKKLGINLPPDVTKLITSGAGAELLKRLRGGKEKAGFTQQTQLPPGMDLRQHEPKGLETWQIAAIIAGGAAVVGIVVLAVMKKKRQAAPTV